MPIALGSRGTQVRELQLKLKALDYNPGDVDGIFGQKTLAALKRFQADYESLDETGELDAETAAALDQALVVREHESPDAVAAPEPVPCDPQVWSRFMGLVELVAGNRPVGYGPGRGLFHDGKWIVTYGPGKLGSKSWKTHRDATYPSFHCTSWTNFFLSWLLRYNQDYTHAGNIPSLFALLEQSRELHANPGGGDYRGYGPSTTEIVSDGTTYQRAKIPKVIDIRELYARRANLPTFLVCGQSTHRVSGWKWWHHTVVFAIDHRAAGSPMHRIAADGFKDGGGYSGKPMQWISIDPDAFATFDNCIYRVWGVDSADGKYGGDRSIADVVLEQ